MSRPIKLTDELKRSVVEEFAAALDNFKMADGKINYSKVFQYKSKDKATLTFTAEAYDKMATLIMSFDSEVAWHGVGHRTEGANFVITDILVYPQTVTGTTVEMDEEEYVKWLMSGDERLDHIIMQGHSHVNMGVTPSAVDLKHQDDILSQLSPDMFYIFVIWNKRGNNTIKIYDLANNTLYDDDDVEYVVMDEEKSVYKFAENAKEVVKRKAIGYSSASNHSGSSSNQSSKSKVVAYNSDDDDDDYYGDYYGGHNSYRDDYYSSYGYSGSYSYGGSSSKGGKKGSSAGKGTTKVK